MNKIKIVAVSVIFALSQAYSSVPVKAEEFAIQTVVINELQTNGAGTGTSSQEFIELKNLSAIPIDISGWELVYTPSSGLATSEKLIYKFANETIVGSNAYLVIAPQDYLTAIIDKFVYQGTSTNVMAATSGSVELRNGSGLVIDLVGWGTSSTTKKETELMSAPQGGSSIQRKIIDERTIDSNNNKNDFEELLLPTPLVVDEQIEENIPEDTEEQPETPQEQTNTESPTDETEENTEVPEPEQPANEIPEEPKQSFKILLNELFIDPESPELDANDEWVELFNPYETQVDISGYKIESGATFSYSYTLPLNTIVEPNSYYVITSGNTPIALANGGGAARIVAPDGEIIDSITYGEAKPGYSWAREDNGQWTWTTSPTNNAVNVITIATNPLIKKAASKAKVKKAAKKKTTKVKAATTKKKTTKAKKSSNFNDENVALVAAPTPLPWWLLASLLTLAILYVGYEYRFELANTVYRFKQHRRIR